MNSRTTPKTHLVPVIKGVSDPKKGLIFRTYHVRPEQLATSLRNATAKVDKTHINRIKNYNNLSKTIQTNDITHLRTMFSKNSSVWPSLVKRNNANIDKHTHAKQKLFQSVYAYMLSQDSSFLGTIKNNARLSSTIKVTNVLHNENKQSKQRKVSESYRVSEQVFYTPKLEKQSALTPVTLPSTQNKYALISNEENKQEIDTGKVLRKTTVVEEKKDYENVGNELSAFINFLNPSANKIEAIHSTLSGKSDDGDGLAKHMILRPNIYKQNKAYWADSLSNSIVQHHTIENAKLSDDILFYNNLLLKDLDSKRFYSVYDTYPDKNIAFVIANQKDANAILNSTTLNEKQKALYVAALDTKQTTDNKSAILEKARSYYVQNDTNNALLMMAAYSNHLDPDTTYRLVNSTIPDAFDVDRIVYSVFENDTKDAFSYLLLQVLCAKVAKLHYTPYSDASMFKDTPFLPVLVMKVFSNFTKLKVKDLAFFIKKNKSSSIESNPLVVGLKAPDTVTKDGQLFMKLNPAMVLDIFSEGGGFVVKGTVLKNTIISDGYKVLICDPAHSIKFS